MRKRHAWNGRRAGVRMRGVALLSAVLCLASGAADEAVAQPVDALTTGCARCHASLDDPRLSAPVDGYRDDVHLEYGFTCVECHGGDGATDDQAAAKAAATGYQGAPAGVNEIRACARCHSDAEFMRRYAPGERVDQAAEYAVSVHGQLLGQGRADVATCSSCHGVHGIRRIRDAASPVFPLNVAATCGACHADPKHMGDRPTNQLADYETSVHHAALAEQDDLSAPTCNDCHGNHGAAPPGVEDVSNVCSTCHAVFGTRYGNSTHSMMFGCVECHGNHAVMKTSDDMLGVGQGAVCVECHGEGERGYQTAARLRELVDGLVAGIDSAETLTAEIDNDGMDVADQELALTEARSRLTRARTELHASDVGPVEPVVAEGLEIVRNVEETGASQLEELRYRRVSLAVWLVVILMVTVLLWLKIRQLDHRHHVGRHEPEIERQPPPS